MFDWIGIIGVIGGVGGAISIWNAVKFRKQEAIKADADAHKSKAEAYQQDITASDSAMQTIKNLNEMVKELVDDRIDNSKEINSLKNDIQQAQKQIKVVIHKFKLVTEILGEQIELKQHAESHFCSVVECTLREPPLSSYQTSNATNRMKEWYEDLKREKIDIDGFDEVETDKEIKVDGI